MAADNLLFKTVAPGTPFTLPLGFLFASFYPASGASYTITNSLEHAITNEYDIVSGAIDTAFTVPTSPSLDGWAEHTITATDGNITVVFATGI